jgi:hypothetical protein
MAIDHGWDEGWKVILDLLPIGWEQQAYLCGAMERQRDIKSPGDLLRTLLLHVGKGYSLRETVVRAKLAGLAEISDVALLKRLRRAEHWLRWLCTQLFEGSGWEMPADARGYNLRAVDGTLIKQPGQNGTLWRVHYSLQIPSLECDYFQVTLTKGKGTSEKLERFPAREGDLVLADRGFSFAAGIAAMRQRGAHVIVRVNTASLILLDSSGKKKFDLLEAVRGLQEAGEVADWPVRVSYGKTPIAGRICAVRKSQEASERAQRKIKRKAQQGGPVTKASTLEFAGYVIVFTTLPEVEFTPSEVLEWYRLRWQIELIFKKLKSLMELGQLPKHGAESARAWLYGKLLVSLLGRALMRLGRDISPWGYRLPGTWQWQRLAGVSIHWPRDNASP